MEIDEKNKKILHCKLGSYIGVFNELEAKDYPWSASMYGIGHIIVMNQQEMAGRVRELCSILNLRNDLMTKEVNGELRPHFEIGE